MDTQHTPARRLVAGCLADFLIYLTNLPEPVIVGGNYPRDRLILAFQNWAKDRNFNIDQADISVWRAVCREKLFLGE